jgi:hypothetical protein
LGKYRRRYVAKARMPPLTVIKYFYVFPDAADGG